MTASSAIDPTQAHHHLKHRKLLASGVVGSSIEWYDFFLYGTAAALVFPHVFFPSEGPLVATLLSFATFWAGFIARPLGGVIAGHYGDKLGRKPVVVVSLIVMGIATFVIGCLPGAASIGLVAPIALGLCRFAQGLAAGGQWGGLALLLTESAGPKNRAYSGSFNQIGVPAGAFLGNIVFITATYALTQEQFISWGWRIPFWFTAVLFPVVLFIHHKVEDSPEFRELEKKTSETQSQIVKAPLWVAVKKHWKTILLGCGLLASTNCIFYISIAGVLSYGANYLGLDRTHMLIAGALACVIGIVTTPLLALWSDRIGRRPVVIVGGAGIFLFVPIYFMLINTGNIVLFGVAVCVSSVFQCAVYAPLAAYLGELFEPEVRFSGASLAYQLAAILISGATPILMTSLIASSGNTHGVTIMVMIMGVITVVSALLLKETNPKWVREDPHAVPGEFLYEQKAVQSADLPKASEEDPEPVA